MGRRYRRKKKNKVTLIVIGVIVAAAIVSGLGISLRDFIVAEIIIGVVVLAILVFILIWNLPSVKGKRGERTVRKTLERIANRYGGYVINDVIVPGNNGGTSQIDHIMFSTFGIVVVETKNYSGRLYGKANQQYWTQVLAYGNTKNQLYNPILQNQSHIYHLKQITGNKIEFYSCVVILRADLDYLEEADEVYTLKEFKTSLKNSLRENNYNADEIYSAYEKVFEYKTNPIATSKEHVQNIKTAQKNIDKNICPRCGGELVLRTSKSGYQFYGCKNYPKCKFTKKA